MSQAKQQSALHAHNEAVIAALFKVDVETTRVWKYERGCGVITAQAGYTQEHVNELEASAAFWNWFTYEWNKFNIRYMVLYRDILAQWQMGNMAARKTLCAVYKADLTQWLDGEQFAYTYAAFIGEYIDATNLVKKHNND